MSGGQSRSLARGHARMAEVLGKYRESAPGTRREFTLYTDRVQVVGHRIGGSDFSICVPLQEMFPDYGYLHFRSRRYLYGFMLLAAFSLLLWIFLGPFHLPITSPRVLLTIALAILSLASSLYYLPKYKAYRFANKSGIVAIDIIEAGPEKARCREFADLLAQTIRVLTSAAP